VSTLATIVGDYTPCSKKTKPPNFGSNFVKS